MHSLMTSLLEEDGVTAVDAAGHEAFLEAGVGRLTVLFFAGDVQQRPEALDVAVVLREMLRADPGRLRVGVIAREAEGSLMKALKVFALPSLAFFNGPRLIEVIPKIQDWSVYAQKLPGLLAVAEGVPVRPEHGEARAHA